MTGLLLAMALWPLLSRTRSWGVRAGTVLLLVTAVFGGFAWKARAHTRLAARQQLQQKLPTTDRPGGYVQSETCRSCHPDQYASWHRSYHRTMTQQATAESVRGNFTNITLTLQNESFHLTRRGGEFWVEMVDPDWTYVRDLQAAAFQRGQGSSPRPEPNPPRVQKRITMTTGSHHMQACWVAGRFGNQQFSLPFTYLFEEQRWVPRNDVFLMPDGQPHPHQVWNVNCLHCHTTAGQPQQDPRTSVINSRAAEYGIACEACHGPGGQHMRANTDPRRRYALHRSTNGDPTIVNPGRVSAKKSSEICGQCHAARYSPEPNDWLVAGTEYWQRPALNVSRPLLPGRDMQRLDPQADEQQAVKFIALSGFFWRDGMVRVSGREYNGLVETPCFQRGNMSCLSCHSMHRSDPDDQLARGHEGNQACYQCHGDYVQKLAQHTHHATGSSGSLCYNCHMPHTTYGLLKAIRSHQITSPNVKSSLDTGRPNACNLCHLDQSLVWTAQHLITWYRQPVPTIEDDFKNTPASVVWILRGDAGQRALIAWHMGWEPAKQISGTNWLAPYLAETLDDSYSVVRYIGQRSLKRLPGYERLAYDYIAPAEQRARVKNDLLQSWNPDRLRAEERAKVLPPQQSSQLRQRRDNHPMELLE